MQTHTHIKHEFDRELFFSHTQTHTSCCNKPAAASANGAEFAASPVSHQGRIKNILQHFLFPPLSHPSSLYLSLSLSLQLLTVCPSSCHPCSHHILLNKPNITDRLHISAVAYLLSSSYSVRQTGEWKSKEKIYIMQLTATSIYITFNLQ